MQTTRELCNIEMYKNGRYFIKYPKLMELHEYLFGEVPTEELHNSLVDSLICLKCYLKFQKNINIHPAKYRHMLKNILKIK
jgi:DNA polymerase III epsilon subunit-like protein